MLMISRYPMSSSLRAATDYISDNEQSFPLAVSYIDYSFSPFPAPFLIYSLPSIPYSRAL
jgi:hypothetical protein